MHTSINNFKKLFNRTLHFICGKFRIRPSAYLKKTIFITCALTITSLSPSCKKEVCDPYDPTCSIDAAYFLYVVLTSGSKKFVAVGEDGMIWTSSDGITRTYSTIYPKDNTNFPLNYDLNGVAYGGGKYVAVGDNGIILYSKDGYEWTETTGGAPYDATAATEYHFTDVVYGDGKFLAIGCQPDGGSTDICASTGTDIPVMRWSRDGIRWNSFSLPPTVGISPSDIAYGNNLFYASGETSGTTTYSYNFTTDVWSLQDPTVNFSDIEFGGDRFVATVNGSAATYYVDFSSGTPGAWTASATPPASTAMLGLTYASDHFVAVGAPGVFSQSTTGDTWSDGSMTCTGNLNSIAFGNDRLVAVGGTATASSTCVNEDGTGSVWSETLEAGGALNRIIFVK